MARRIDTLRGGVDALFGEEPIQRTQEETVPDIINSVRDEELREALLRRQRAGSGRPKKGRHKDPRTDGYGTVCVKANLQKWAKLEYISLHETLQKKEVLEMALDMLIGKYESEKGEIIIKEPDKTGNVFNK